MLTIYNKPHRSRQAEAAFVQALRVQFPEATFVAENYPISEQFLAKYVHTPSLLAALDTDTRLSARQREQCRAILSTCPEQLQVALDPKRISCDVVITDEQRSYFWEYHENQHRSLNVIRPQHIYDAQTGKAVTVPRFVQRLVRDIWRLQYLWPYTIVWKDWFAQQQSRYQPQLQQGLHEYVLPNRFSFKTFYRAYLTQESQA